MSNANLNAAKKAKNDEFYTMYEDIENELQHYPGAFEGKIVYCNCDNPEWSNFWKYFHLNFEKLGLKRLVSTHYERDVEKNGHPYKMEYTGGNDADITVGVKTPLTGNGDFASQECTEILQEADVVVTNPPFSEFRRYIDTLISSSKNFFIIGPKNAIAYKNIFPSIKSGNIQIGKTNPKKFMTRHTAESPGGGIKTFGNIGWLIADGIKITESQRIPGKFIELAESYADNKYARYSNYDAINCDRVSDIPRDYAGAMGVPISFMDKFCYEQFELIDSIRPVIDGRVLYTRIIIKNRHPEPPADNQTQ